MKYFSNMVSGHRHADAHDPSASRPMGHQSHSSVDSTRSQPTSAAPVVGEVKPRLTKEQHDVLESHFQQQNKPSTNIKKGFADNLNVSLEKVNNWFQNRRAKKKNDEKKQLQAMNMIPSYSVSYPPEQSFPHPTGQPEFCSSTPNLLQTTPQADATGPYGTGRFFHSQASLSGDYGSQLHSISETDQPATMGTLYESLAAAGYPIPQNGAGQLPPQSRDPFGLAPSGHPSNAPDRSEFNRSFSLPVAPSGFENSFSNDPGFDFSNYSVSASTSMLGLDTHVSMSNEPSTFSATHSASASISSAGVNPSSNLNPTLADFMDDHNSPLTFPCGSQHEGSIDGSVGNAQPMDSASPPDAAMWAPVAVSNQMNFMSHPGLYMHENNSSHHALCATPDHTEGITLRVSPSNYDPPVSFPEGAFGRRSSSTAGLAESMINVGLQGQEAFVGDVSHSPSRSPSIASRRQRPRPAALGQASLRSASYGSGAPVSPGAAHSFNPDHSLRRIQSSGIVNPRVHKPRNRSAGRSPINLSFSEASARYNTITTPAVSNQGSSLAPPTPQSPNETSSYGEWQNYDVPASQPPHSQQNAPDAWTISWGPEMGMGQYSTVASPPSTPMDYARLAPGHARMNSASMVKDTPPQSAPASQQAFPGNAYAQRQSTMPEPPATNGYNTLHMPRPQHPQHMRSPSMPDPANHNAAMGHHMKLAVPMVNEAGDLQMAYPQQFMPQQPDMNGVSGSAGPFQPGPTFPYSVAPNTVPSSAPAAADFQVLQYHPPQGTGPPRSPRRTQEMPMKSFKFENHSVQDFNKSS